MLKQDLESQIVDHERQSKEFEIQNETLDREISELLAFCKVSEEQLTTYVSSPDYFTASQWDILQQEKKRLDDALEHKLSCIPNLAKKKKVQMERIISPHWLFVR